MKVSAPAAAAVCALLVFAGGANAAGVHREPANGPDPATAEWAEWPHPVSCGDLPFDPVAVFSGPTNAELGTSPSEQALHQFLAKRELPWVRLHSWRLLVESGGIAEFAAGRLSTAPSISPPAELEWMLFQRIHGRWKWRSYTSNCEPRSVRRDIPAITWTLAAGQHLGFDTRQVRVDLGPGECDDGRSQNARVQKPEFREQNGDLVMTLWLRPVSPGGHTCVGIIEPPLLVRLPEALGDRELVDGGTYPPRPALQPASAHS